MKKLLHIVMLLVLCVVAHGQTVLLDQMFTPSVSSSPQINLASGPFVGLNYIRVEFTPTPSSNILSCSLTVDSLPLNGTTWQQGGAVSAQNCATQNNATAGPLSVSALSVYAVITGSGSVRVRVLGSLTTFAGSGGAASALSSAVTTNTAGSFVTSPTPPAGAAGGFGAGNQPCSFFLGFTDAGCAAATNIYTFASATPNSFRHGWNYYYQTDATQANDPIGMTLMCGVVPAASGLNSTDMYCQEIGAFVGGGNAWSNGNPAAQKLRIGLVTTGTSVTGNMGGSLFYLPSFPTGTTLTGGIFGYACDAASTTGTVTGGYVCVEGGTIIGGANVFGSHTNPAFGINTGSGTTNDAYCWGSLGGTNIFTPTICNYQGAGSPQGVVTANVGSSYLDNTNGNSWVKNTGTGNTGWSQNGGSGYQAAGVAGVSAGPYSSLTSIQSSGGINTTLTGTSDARLKTNIQPFTRGLDAIMKLHPSTYSWNDIGQKVTGFRPEEVHAGFIAQDVQKAIPEAVGSEAHCDGDEHRHARKDAVAPCDGGSATDYLTIADRPILAATVNALQQYRKLVKQALAAQKKQLLSQAVEIELLKTQVAALRH